MAAPLNRNATLLKLAGVVLAAGVLVAGSMLPIVGGIGLAAKTQSDKFLTTTCDLQETAPPQKTTLYANDGKTVLATLFAQDRQPVPLSQVPKYLQQALIATEDRRFYSHTGVDMRGLLRSALHTGSGDTQGGSTLTMQYVKQVRYYQYVTTAGDTEAEKAAAAAGQQAAISQNLDRKIEDANCALYLENVKHESKDEILDNYLNIAFFGQGSYGIQSAAQNFFNKDVSKLTLAESAMLVGALQAPDAYNPFEHLQAAKDRRNQVLQNLVDVGDISQSAADAAKAEPIVPSNVNQTQASSDCSSAVIANAGFFCDYAEGWLSETKTLTTHQLLTGGYKIVTTLDPALQSAAQQRLSAVFPATSPSAAIMPMIDPKTGNVLAMVSNKQYGNADGQTTVALFTTAAASAASTMKYFTALAALKTGVPTSQVITAASPYVPGACRATGTPLINPAGSNIPTTTTMADAFARSSNTYFLAVEDRIFSKCDLTPVVKTAVDLGDTYLSEVDPDSKNTSKQTYAQEIIGGQTYSFTLGSTAAPLDMTAAYAASANDGTYCQPAPVLSITDPEGTSLQVKRSACAQKFAPQVARNMMTMMTGETQGAGTSASAFADFYAKGGSPIGGKTGTQDAGLTANAAAWYIGTTPDLTATIAIYNPANPSGALIGVPGAKDGQADGTLAAKLWAQVITPSLAGKSWNWQNPNVLAGGVSVPNVVGKSVADATTTLSAAGFKLQDYGAANGIQLNCSGPSALGAVAYQAPSTVAAPGSTITVCASTGIKPPSAPVSTPAPARRPSSPTRSSRASAASTPGG